MKYRINLSSQKALSALMKNYLVKTLVVVLGIFINLSLFAQDTKTITGTVVDEQDNPVIGATVIVKGTQIGVPTDIDGKFELQVPTDKEILLISFIGMEPQEINISNQTKLAVVLAPSSVQLEETVVVGYGQQKKMSVVGAISQTDGAVLERAGGVTSLGSALTGNLPGVVTYSSSGLPGEEDPKIIIRTQTSWNNSDPLVLVDGIERPLGSIDISSVKSVSVLKDASATAVYGVKGANGVILITTKRGVEGKANIQIRANTTAKLVSKLPAKYDAYDALMLRNSTIERELMVSPAAWSDYTPMGIINKYRYPANDEERDRYPNIDWEKELFKEYAMSYNTSVNVSGGTKFVNYFSAIDFIHEGDLFKTFQNNRGYKTGYGYNRVNVRSNLDFNLTKTTKFSSNLFGSNAVKKGPRGNYGDASYWASAYRTAPDAMQPIYSDGTWGWYAPRDADQPNSVHSLAVSGMEERTTTLINTDFALTQDLASLVEGLTVKARLSFDNTFEENQRGINDSYNYTQRKWINPATGEVVYKKTVDAGTQLDFSDGINWGTNGGSVNIGATFRKLYYSGQFNYDRDFGKHNVTAFGLFSREKWARGSEFSHFREDWVFRFTYNYAMKYFFEVNGAYNGSEKFGPDNRFAFFPSISAGWMISKESFMETIGFLDMLKIRGSWGRIGDDNVGGRWLYTDEWAYGGNAQLGAYPANTPYTFYRISRLGNINVSWETVEKRNLGIDYALLDGFFAGTVNIFNDERTDILIGDSRAIPSYFGAKAPTANLGIVDSHGYELEFRLNKKFSNGLRAWANINITHAVNKVEFADDEQFKPGYLKDKGYAIGQTRAYIDNGFIGSWDDLYGSTERTANNDYVLPGDYNIVDFNADGVIDTYDKAPYGYTGVPQNTFNTSVGFNWKNFNLSVQFYGVNNVTREITFPTFQAASNVAYDEGTYYSVGSEEGGIPLPRWTTTQGADAAGTRYLYDGSYLRLKNAEIGYTFNKGWIRRVGMKSCKFYINGSNLLLWTDMADDRESNFSGNSSSGAYPTVRRINLGLDITL